VLQALAKHHRTGRRRSGAIAGCGPRLGDITQRRARAGYNLLITGSDLLEGGMLVCIGSGVPSMFRFDRLIRRDMIVRDVKQRHPETIPIFEGFHFRTVCDDCDIETGARKNGYHTQDVVDALNQAAFGSKADTEEHAGN
jgi:hypothetical protein